MSESDEEYLDGFQLSLMRNLAERNVDALYEIKQCLRTRRPDKQMAVTGILLTCLKDEPLTLSCPLRTFLLEEDMVGFLCDAMATNSIPLIGRVAGVLELLADCDRMLTDGHAVLAAETAQRRAYLLGLLVTEEYQPAVCAILRLLSTLLLRWSSVTVRSVSSLCPPLGLLSTLRLILDSHGRSPLTALSVARTLSSVLQVLVVTAETVDPGSLATSIASCARACLPRLEQLATSSGDQQLTGQACQLICTITDRVISLRASCEDLALAELGAEAERDDDASSTMEALEAEIIPIMMDQCLPRVQEDLSEALSSESERGISHLTTVFLHSLEMCLKFGKDPLALSDTLACKNFLWLLPSVHQIEPHSCIALRVLCSILAHLAYDMLDAGSWWTGPAAGPGGLAAFLYSAADLLPPCTAAWPLVLSRPPLQPDQTDQTDQPDQTYQLDGEAASQLLVLMLTYFRSIAGSDTDPLEVTNLSHHLPAYIMSQPQLPCSVLKMAWMSFSVHCVLVPGRLPSRSRAANERLAQQLLQLPQLGAAYSHHPALLYWTFQPGVPPQLQQRVLELWLARRESPATLLEILGTSRQAVHPMLDVVSAGTPEVAGAAARILAEAAAKDTAMAADLTAGLWGLLPMSLSRGGVGGHQEEGCGLLVWLAAEVYRPPAADMALRVASLLGTAVGRQRLGADPANLNAALQILSNILKDSRRRDDSRVHIAILSDSRFLEAVLDAAHEGGTQVCGTAMFLLRQLEKDNALLKTPTVQLTALPAEVLLEAIYSADVDVFESGLLLLAEVLRSKPHGFLTFEPDQDSVRALYFRLQNQAIKLKTLPAMVSAIWCVMRDLLAKHSALSHQPWNYVLIKAVLKTAPKDLSSEFLAFVLAWLRSLKPSAPPQPTPRRPIPTMLTQTTTEIARVLVDAGEDFQKQNVVRNISEALLEVTANLPAQLMTRVKELAAQRQ